MTPDPQPDRGERRWTIWSCPNCGKRSGGAFFCRCTTPSDRCQAIEVVPASDLEHLQARVEELERDLAECYRLSGADPDGDSDAMLARHAVQACREGREEWDECAGELLAAEQTIAAVREELERRVESRKGLDTSGREAADYVLRGEESAFKAALDLLRGEGGTGDG